MVMFVILILKIFKYNSSGELLISWGGSGDANGKFSFPWGVVIDSNDDVFVSDAYQNRIQKFDSSGNYSTKFGSYGDGDGELRAPLGLGIDSNDRIYIADHSNHRISIFTNTGTWVENIGGATRRIDDARKVIKKFLSEDDIVANTNFGLMTWGWSDSNTILQAEVNEDGAENILKIIDSIDYIPWEGTNLGGAMMKARKYFRGGLSNPKGGVYKSPKNKNAEKCEDNYIIVISDGGWPYGTDPVPIAKDLVKSDQVGSLIVGYKGYTDFKYLYEIRRKEVSKRSWC